MVKFSVRFYVLILVTFILMLLFVPASAYADWPPFKFSLNPTYNDGRITYRVEFSSRADWQMTNIIFKIPLPAGTRFVEANAQPTTDVNFDGTEITFFTAVLYQPIKEASFVVEVIDPKLTVFSAHAWITWEGEQPGNYLMDEISIDITKQSLNWEMPPTPRLQLKVSAAVSDDAITYVLYPENVNRSSRVRMQDVEIRVPLPEQTTLLSAEAAPPFTGSVNNGEVVFSALELENKTLVDPLKFKVSTEGVTQPFVATHAWAAWKNTGRQVGQSIPAEEDTTTGDIVVQPHSSEWVVLDRTGDVPLANYDLTNIAFQDEGSALKIIFYTTGVIEPVGAPLRYIVYVDGDCNVETGQKKYSLGLDYRIRYNYADDRADFSLRDMEQNKWEYQTGLTSSNPAGGNVVVLWVPYDLLQSYRAFCWQAEARNGTEEFGTLLPFDYVPDDTDPRLWQLDLIPTTAVIPASAPLSSRLAGTFIDTKDIWQYLPGWAEPPENWTSIGFDDSNWYSGPTSIGYGPGKHATDLSQVTPPLSLGDTQLLMQRTITQTGVTLAVLPSGEAQSVLMRRTFTISDSAKVTGLTLEVDYEGGFLAYLNGVEVARRGLGEPGSAVAYDSLAADPEGAAPETIDLSQYVARLVSGTNVLAMQAHQSANGSNLSMNPKLAWSYNPANILSQEIAEAAPPPPLASPPVAASSLTGIRGKLAVPVDNGLGFYDIHVFSLLDGQEIAKIPNARQPHFRFDGQRLLINREGGGIENVYEYNLADGTERQVTDAPMDSHPFYDHWGNRVVYGNPELTVGSPILKLDERGRVVLDENGELEYIDSRRPFIFVQCGLVPPHQEADPRCRNIPSLGVLVPAGQVGEIQGTHPVWTTNDMIAYKGCNTWAGSQLCGIFVVPSTSTKGFSDGFIPRQLTRHSSDTPTDTKGNLIAFSSSRDGNWEAYIMDLDGHGIKNLSNNPNSNDGLPTISPDGKWVAFVSDRDGQWAVWVVPVASGSADRLFDLPQAIPWGNGDRAWQNERISWGP